MWIFLNNAFVSAVQNYNDPDQLVVRARKRNDLVELFPHRPIISTPSNDYAFRCYVDKHDLAKVVVDRILGIDYSNFKASVPDRYRHDAYMDVWTAMWRWQNDDYRRPSLCERRGGHVFDEFDLCFECDQPRSD